MSFEIIENELVTKSETKLYGIYRGLVVDNRDPAHDNGLPGGKKIQHKYGRIKVFIPALMEPDENNPKLGIWAMPANNFTGGRNHNKMSKDAGADEWQKYYGTCMIPVIGSYVFIFFEGGNPSRPFYFGACDIVEEEVPPENRVKDDQEWEHRWTIYRSPKGRVIVVSDDPIDERVEITGKKRLDPEKDLQKHVYDIDKEEADYQETDEAGNQKSILIDERDGKEKILIKDEKGNFINIKTKDNELHIFFHGDIHILTQKNIYMESKEDTHITCKNFYLHSSENTHIKADKSIYRTSGEEINDLSGSSTKITSTGSMNIKSKGSDTFIDAAGTVHEQLPGAADASDAQEATKPKPVGKRDK